MNNINVYLRLLNSRRFAAGLHQSAASLRAFHEEVAAANTLSGRLAASGRLAESALYAIGSGSRYAATGVGVFAAAVTYMGLDFNATMEANTMAFEQFTGGAQQAADYVQHLFEVARDTPFQFTDITTAARRFMAFGFSVKETDDLLNTLADTLAYTGGGTDEIFRMTKAFGDIHAKGRLMAQEMLQLTNLGIPAWQILTEKLGLTQKQLGNIGRAGIDADTAIGALQEGLDERFGGGAVRYAATFRGQLEKMKDSARATAGALTEPLFNLLRSNVLPDINKWLQKVTDWARGGGATQIFQKIGGIISKAFTIGKNAVKDWLEAIQPAMPFVQNVLLPILEGIAIALIGGVVVGFKLALAVTRVVAKVLGWIGERLAPLKPLFKGVGVIIGTIFGPSLLSAVGWLGKFGGVFGLVGKVANVALIPLRFFYGVVGFIGRNLSWATRELSFFLQGFRLIGPAIGAVIKLGAAIRTWFVGLFTKGINLVAGFAQRLAGLGSVVVKFGVKLGNWLFVGIRDTIFKIFTGLGAFAASIGRGIADWLNAKTPFGDEVDLGFVSFRIPALATGGLITSAGYALVGEHGPEIASFPRGTTVTPLRPARARINQPGSSMSEPGVFDGGIKAHFTIPVMIGRRQIAEAFGEYISDRELRA